MEIIGNHPYFKGENACVANSLRVLGWGENLPKGFDKKKRLICEAAAVLPKPYGLECLLKNPAGLNGNAIDAMLCYVTGELPENDKAMIPLLVECKIEGQLHCTVVLMPQIRAGEHHCTYTGQIQKLENFSQFPYLITSVWCLVNTENQCLVQFQEQ